MFEELNASSFNYNHTFRLREFEYLLQGIISCYQSIVSHGVKIYNNENDIRDLMLYDYLKVEPFKKAHFNLANYHFDSETRENNGRADIRILPINPYLNDTAYFVIECKRLNIRNCDGVSGLIAEYVKNGICRFITGHYTCYFGINGMIGFVVDDDDIDEIIKHLNLSIGEDWINDKGVKVNANCVEQITQFPIDNGFKYSYFSKHENSNKLQLMLYHLMLDFSKNII